MADILGLHSMNFQSGSEELIAVWHSTPMVRKGDAWENHGVNLTEGTKAEMESFVDCVFLVNGVDNNLCYDGNRWAAQQLNLRSSPNGYLVKREGVRLFLGDVTINDVRYKSRVWHSDFPRADNTLSWGLEYGTNLVQTADSAVVTSDGAGFKSRNIKIGDPITIEDGENNGEYKVQSVDSNTQITLINNLVNTVASSTYWVGGNYFDVETNDGDSLRALGKLSGELLCYKANSLHRYNIRGKQLRRIEGAVGTTSSRGVVSLNKYAYNYHPSGIYRCNGTSTTLISKAIYDFIEGVTAANQSEVVAWSEDNEVIVFYLGDVTLRDGEKIENCAVAYNTTDNTWSPRRYPIDIKCSTQWLKDDVPEVYTGDDSDSVYKMNIGTHFNDADIVFEYEHPPIFPAGDNAIVNFDRLQAYIDNGPDVQIFYKLIYMSSGRKGQWINDKTWQSLKGSQRGEKTEWRFPNKHRRAAGVALKFAESSQHESFLLEKFVLFYSEASL